MISAYYNENDPFAAQWLRNLVSKGLICDGEVDERSIEDVEPGDLRGFTRCHFFAGIAGWDLALALAGWPDDAPVWTGSCPCQPFSVAGKGLGEEDERHLWPVWRELVRECRPSAVFGEQTESAAGWAWLDSVRADLETQGYAVGAACVPAAGIGAPHLRHRLWFVAYASGPRRGRPGRPSETALPAEVSAESRRYGDAGSRQADSVCPGRGQSPKRNGQSVAGFQARQPGRDAHGRGHIRRVGDAGRQGSQKRQVSENRQGAIRNQGSPVGPPSAWGDAEWVPCSDGKHRPVEAGTFPLAPRLPGDVGKLRAFGNSIAPAAACEFIKAAMGGDPTAVTAGCPG